MINKTNKSSLAPVIIFVYNRLWHTKKTIHALLENDLADQSEIVIYSDGPKNEKDYHQVMEVRNYIKKVNGFRSLKIIEREKNWGLAGNIIDGVTKVINEYGKIIVLEDDIVTSPSYLLFMNQALDFYKNEDKVWHIAGWNNSIKTEGLHDAFFWRVMNCWGWATWSDKWSHFNKNSSQLIEKWSIKQKNDFDLNGSNIFWSQVIANANKKLNTWAIFWYATIFENNGLCLNSSKSYVYNIGLDGSGVHRDNSNSNLTFKPNLCNNKTIIWPIKIEESNLALRRIKKQIRPNYIKVIFKRLLKLIS